MTTITGTEGNDALIGTPAADVIRGVSGNDTLIGWGGDHILDGGSGNDRLDGSAGADQLIDGAGNDTCILADPGDRVTERSPLLCVSTAAGGCPAGDPGFRLCSNTHDVRSCNNLNIVQ